MANSSRRATVLTRRFQDALAFATDLHRGQVRKDGTTPYMAHLMAVSSLVLEYGGTETQAIAALLHDSLEDQADTYPGGREALSQEIEELYGPEVYAIVEACTDDQYNGVPDSATPRQESWHSRKQRFLESLDRVPPESLLVIAADKLHNVTRLVLDYREHGEEVWKRFHVKEGEAQIAYYRQIAQILPRLFPGELTRRVAEAVEQLDRLWDEANNGSPETKRP